MKLSQCPWLGVYIYILEMALKEILAFFMSVLALILGFAFSFHLISSSSLHMKNPMAAFLSVLTMIVGHFEESEKLVDSAKTPGTTQAIFSIFYVVLSIGVMNILIGLCVSNIKDVMLQKEDFRHGVFALTSLQYGE